MNSSLFGGSVGGFSSLLLHQKAGRKRAYFFKAFFTRVLVNIFTINAILAA